MCRGFGYVTFALVDDAQRAIDVVKKFGGRQLSVCFADKKPKHEKRKMKQGGNTEVHNIGSQGKLLTINKAVYMYLLQILVGVSIQDCLVQRAENSALCSSE